MPGADTPHCISPGVTRRRQCRAAVPGVAPPSAPYVWGAAQELPASGRPAKPAGFSPDLVPSNHH